MRLEIDKREWKQHLQKYMHSIRKAKHQTWRIFVESADEKSIWKIKKVLPNIAASHAPTSTSKLLSQAFSKKNQRNNNSSSAQTRKTRLHQTKCISTNHAGEYIRKSY